MLYCLDYLAFQPTTCFLISSEFRRSLANHYALRFIYFEIVFEEV